MASPGFWDDQEKARKVIAQVKGLKDRLTDWDELKARYEDVAVLFELVDEEPEEELCQERKRRRTSSSGRPRWAGDAPQQPYDAANALLSIHPGAGTESGWASMLVRMYTRWAKQGMGTGPRFSAKDEAGVKRHPIGQGTNAYGCLKAEGRPPFGAHLPSTHRGGATLPSLVDVIRKSRTMSRWT